MSSGSNSDNNLSTILPLQAQYINNIQTLNAQTPNPNISSNLNELSNSLDSLYSTYQTVGASEDATLTKQADVNKLLSNEQQRLADKKTRIDQALDGQKRLISLNDSYRLRYTQYIKMVIIAIIVLVTWTVLNQLNALGLLPGPFYAFLLVILITAGIFSCYFIYLDILNRDNMNFNEITIPPPTKLTPEEIKKNQEAAAAAGNLLGTINFNGCLGAECCSTGSKWDQGNSVCIGNSYAYGVSSNRFMWDGFTTLTITGQVKTPVSANSPNEYDQYSKV